MDAALGFGEAIGLGDPDRPADAPSRVGSGGSGRTSRREPGARVEWSGQIALVMAVASRSSPAVAGFVHGQLRTIVPIRGSYWDTGHEGVELALFPAGDRWRARGLAR